MSNTKTKTLKNSFAKRVLAFLLAAVMAVLSFPVSTLTASAAVDYLPDEMQDNAILRALEYLGYDVSGQKEDGNLFTTYAWMSGAAKYRTSIPYNAAGSTGLETVTDSSTVTGKAPDLSTFYSSSGLCCGSFVAYVLGNYLPNIEGNDNASSIINAVKSAGGGTNASLRTAANWYTGLNNLASQSSSIVTKKSSISDLEIGDIIVYRAVDGTISHVAIYAGYYNGDYFLIHVSGSRGPEIGTHGDMYTSSAGDKQADEAYYYHLEDVYPSYGAIEVNKTDTDGNNLAGAIFKATNNNTGDVYYIGPTNSSGYAKNSDIPYGTYTVVESTFPTNYHSYGQTSWTVTVSSSNNGVVTIDAVNEEDFGTIKLTKTSEDGIVSGIKFTVVGNGKTYTCTTNSDGEFELEDLKSGTYTITEESITRYVENESVTVTVKPNEVTEVSFSNILKKFRVTLTKTDSETGTAQGDASLAGAVYGIYKDGELVDTYTTDANGQFTTDYYICDTDWTIQEITPSEGYLLDETVYTVGADPKDYTIELNTTYNDVTEDVIKGQISIIKHTDDGSTQIETPEVGATFEVYLKSAGSYDDAEETERDILVCDEDGYAITKELPYGVYTVHQRIRLFTPLNWV